MQKFIEIESIDQQIAEWLVTILLKSRNEKQTVLHRLKRKLEQNTSVIGHVQEQSELLLEFYLIIPFTRGLVYLIREKEMVIYED